MSIEKNFEKEKYRNLFFLKCFFFQFFLGDHCLIEESELPVLVSALSLVSESKNCFPQHRNFVRNSFFFTFRTEKNCFIRLSFIDSFFTLNVNFELRYCNFGVQHSLENLVYDFVSTKLFSSGYKHVSSTY